MAQAPTSFTTSEAISAFSVSPAEFLRLRPEIHNLIAGAMVFRFTHDGDIKTLLLQRAPSDSFPLMWEIPAGTADPAIDRSITSVAVRELWEETQLRAQHLHCLVGLGLPNGVTKLALTGESEAASIDPEYSLCLLRVSGLTWAIVTFITDVEDDKAEVVLQPKEHVGWAWVTENEVSRAQFDRDEERNINFVSEAMRMTLLEGFKLRKEMM